MYQAQTIQRSPSQVGQPIDDSQWTNLGPARELAATAAEKLREPLQRHGATMSDLSHGLISDLAVGHVLTMDDGFTMRVVRINAPISVILGFLAGFEDTGPWVPVSGDGPWMTTATFRTLLRSGRLTIQRFNQVTFHGELDGLAIVYTFSLFGAILPGTSEIEA